MEKSSIEVYLGASNPGTAKSETVIWFGGKPACNPGRRQAFEKDCSHA